MIVALTLQEIHYDILGLMFKANGNSIHSCRSFDPRRSIKLNAFRLKVIQRTQHQFHFFLASQRQKYMRTF